MRHARKHALAGRLVNNPQAEETLLIGKALFPPFPGYAFPVKALDTGRSNFFPSRPKEGTRCAPKACADLQQQPLPTPQLGMSCRTPTCMHDKTLVGTCACRTKHCRTLPRKTKP